MLEGLSGIDSLVGFRHSTIYILAIFVEQSE